MKTSGMIHLTKDNRTGTISPLRNWLGRPLWFAPQLGGMMEQIDEFSYYNLGLALAPLSEAPNAARKFNMVTLILILNYHLMHLRV
jgi:hypothetical protein